MCNSVRQQTNEMPLLSRFMRIIIFLIFVSMIYLVVSFSPKTYEEQMEHSETEDIDPFRRNLTECADQVKASTEDVESFLKRMPQRTMQGKCFVACILKRNSIITHNKINMKNLLEGNKAVYGEDSKVWETLQKAMSECSVVVGNIYEVCEYASTFNDCMHMKMDQIFHMTEQGTEVPGQNRESGLWSDDEDEMFKLGKDEF